MTSIARMLSLSVIVGIFFHSPTFASLQDKLSSCAKIQSNQGRLNCYDQLIPTNNNLRPKYSKTISSKFLHSEIRADKAVSEYQLAVKDFLELIKIAVMDDNRKIGILGWEKKQQNYILHLRMRQSVSLVFQYISSSSENFSVLNPVVIDGVIMDPAVFITNIASMSPDE